MLKHTFALILSVVLASSALADSQPLSFAGIWQDEQNPSHYYSIHERGLSLVLIDLSQVERKGNALTASYVGTVTELVLTRIEPEVPATLYDRMSLHFDSSTEGMILPICETCSVVETRIRKVF